MTRCSVTLIALACCLVPAPGDAHGARPVGTVVSAYAGLPLAPFTITFLMPGGEPDAAIVTFDGKRWRVEPHAAFTREERCRFRADARRVITGRPVTQGVPRWCMSKRDRELRPDPDPRAR